MSEKRWNLPGTCAEQFNNWPVQAFSEMESSLCVQQYLQQLLFHSPDAVEKCLKAPQGVDELVWQYEHIRMFITQMNHLVALLDDSCNKETCPVMESDGQRFLCAAHNPPSECCAMSYMCHTIDKASQFVQNQTLFPGRMDVPKKSAEQFGAHMRRLYRIFLHAHQTHRETFEEFEQSMWLCRRFSMFATKYNLMDAASLTVPLMEPAGKKEEEEKEEEKEDDDDDDGDGEEQEEEEEEGDEENEEEEGNETE